MHRCAPALQQRQTRQTMRARSRAQEAAAAAAAAVAAAASVHHTSILFGPLDEEFGSAWSWQADSRPIDIFAPQPRDMGVRVGDNALEPALGMQTAAHQPHRVTAARRTTRTAPHRRAQFLSDENISHADSLSHSTRFSMPDLSQAPATLAPLTAAQASTSIPAHAGVHAPLFGVEKGHELEASGMSVEEATLAALRPQRMWQREQQQRSVVQEASVVSASTAQASATT
ncbi:hypothetical protein EON66_07275 [archaeon]|nr:MAG: hypothetical protein EON66_07275 [archaeon]